MTKFNKMRRQERQRLKNAARGGATPAPATAPMAPVVVTVEVPKQAVVEQVEVKEVIAAETDEEKIKSNKRKR